MRPLIRALAGKVGFSPMAWLRDTRRMRKRIRDFELKHPPRPDSPHFAIVLTPWMGTTVPWFSLVCGLLLASNGNKVTFIVDDLPFGEHGARSRFVTGCIRSVLRQLQGRHPIIRLSDRISGLPLDDTANRSIRRLADLNAVWALRGEMTTGGRERHIERTIRQLGAGYGAIRDVLQEGRYDALLVPGGVWGSSGIWVERARLSGVRVASYDSGGYGNLLLAVDGIACQLQDIPRAFSLLKTAAAPHESHALVLESALSEMQRRRSGTDKFASQLKNTREVDGRFKGAVLLALNSSWDSAALGLHAVFDSTAQWIVETTRYLLDNTPVPVIVRQHPVERLAIARSSDDYRDLLTRHFGDHPRLHFIGASDPINSYDLLEQVAAVVVYTSTIGIEAAAHGKAVVTSSRSYYADLGFVRKATLIDDYQEALSDAVSGRFVVTPAMRDDALRCYYLTQCCNWVFTPFTTDAFAEWSRQDLHLLSQHDSVQSIVTALEQNIPVAFVNHLARVEQTASERSR